VINSTPPSPTSAVSSDLPPPAIDGFQATAADAAIGVRLSGVAKTSRPR
jgi:hypothetical protein